MTDKKPPTITADQADEILDASYGEPGEIVDGFTFIATIEGDQRRWMQGITIVVSDSEDVFWGLDYDRGLTENQENHYPWQGYGGRTDVELTRLYPHTITTTTYRTKPATAEGGAR